MPTRIGIIGAGQAGAQHARAVLASERAAVGWIADPDRSRGQALAAECRARYHTDYHEGLADTDAVCICVPHAALADVAVTAALAGVHVLLEKPMATTLEDADRVLEATRRADIRLMVGFVHRFRPEARRAYELIAAGTIGEPSFLSDRSVGGGQSSWPAWVQDSRAGGGLLLYAGVHRIDRARWLLGREVRTATGSTAALLPSSDVESSSAALLTLDGDVRAVLSHHYHAIDVPHTWETDIHGAEGMVRIHTGEGVEIVNQRGSRHEATGPDRRFDAQIAAFLDTLAGQQIAIPSGEDGRAALAIVVAIAESQKTGRTTGVHLRTAR